jgi:hypothetical protein
MASLVITLAGTTYAFIILSNEADIDDFNVVLENQEGLLISVDGENFYNHISSEMLIEAIEKYQGNEKSFDEFKFNGITIKNEDNSTNLDLTGDKFNVLMDVEEPVLDDEGNPDLFSGKKVHVLKEASLGSYVAFDVWFRLINGANTIENKLDYGLYFNESTKLECSPTEITLMNKLTTLVDGEYNTLGYQDKLLVNPLNAMRIAVLTHNDELTTNIFEPYLGLGSSAIESKKDSDDPLHDPNKNAMYTYYQSMNPLSKFEHASYDSVQYDTIGLDGLNTTLLGLFKFNSTPEEGKDNYDIVKLTLLIYLDGWDADYLMGIASGDIKISLGFGIEAIN